MGGGGGWGKVVYATSLRKRPANGDSERAVVTNDTAGDRDRVGVDVGVNSFGAHGTSRPCQVVDFFVDDFDDDNMLPRLLSLFDAVVGS